MRCSFWMGAVLGGVALGSVAFGQAGADAAKVTYLRCGALIDGKSEVARKNVVIQIVGEKIGSDALPPRMNAMSSMASDWKIYRTRFLIKAKQLDAPLVFTDPLGREHCGGKGDYLVESSDGLQRIAPREIFEDIYVPMGPAGESWPSPSEPTTDLPRQHLTSRRSAINRSFVA